MNPRIKMAFLAGAFWEERNTRVADDGDGHWDRINPTLEELEAAASEYAKRSNARQKERS